MERTFNTPSPVDLFLEFDRGQVIVMAGDTTESTIRVEGDQPERVRIEYSGNQLSAVVERRSVFDFGAVLQVWATVPTGSRAVVRTGSADVRTSGRLASANLQTGSGDVELAEVTGTGSGDVQVDHARGRVVAKAASGNIVIEKADDDLQLNSASGDVEVGRLRSGEVAVSTASGSVRLGVPPAIPVWTDISTITGKVTSDLVGAGRPEPGQESLRLRAKTVSGDVRLVQLETAEDLR